MCIFLHIEKTLTEVFIYMVNRYHVFYPDDARGKILEGHQQKTFREKEVQEGKNLTLFYRKERGTE